MNYGVARLQSKRDVIYRSFAGLCLLTVSVALVGCGQPISVVGDPVNASSETPDPELRQFLASLVSDVIENPRSAMYRGRLAMGYDANTFTDAAISTYQQARQLDPADVRWPYLESLAQSSQGRIEHAVQLMDEAIQLDATYLPTYLAKGFWLLDLGKYAEACETFEQAEAAISRIDEKVPLVLGTAQCKLELGDIDAAVENIGALPEEGLSPYAELVRDRVKRAGGNTPIFEISDETSNKPVKISWSDPIAGAVIEFTRGLSGESILAQNLINGGRAQDALSLLESLQERHPGEPHLIELHSAALTRLGRPHEAIDVLREGLSAFPDEHLLPFNLGLLFESVGQLADALEHYNQTIERKNDFVPAYDAKANLLVAQGKAGLARQTLEASLTHRVADANTYYVLGVITGGEGDWSQSVSYLSKANSLEPDNVDVLASLALSLSEMHRYEDALVAINRAKAIDPNNAKVERAVTTLIASGVFRSNP